MASAKIVELDASNTCKLCDNALAKYSCPKCNIIYCSLECYQSPNHLQCSENFYKDNVLEELNSQTNSEESKAKILEILQRTHENNRIISSEDHDDDDEGDDSDEDYDYQTHWCDNISDSLIDNVLEEMADNSDDDEIYASLADRMANMNFDDADTVWDNLTEDEKQGFVSFLQTEDVTKYIPSWEAWWLYYNDSLIEELSENGNTSEEFKEKCPKVVNIKAFSEISAKAPAECAKYNLVNILAAYVFTVRYFNGEHFDFCHEAVACIAALSINLKKQENVPDSVTAIKSVEQQCINCDWIQTDAENIQLMQEDTHKVLKGPNKNEPNFYVLCALSDLYNLIKECEKPQESTDKQASNFSKAFPNDHLPNVDKPSTKELASYAKKVEYFLSFSKDCYN